MFESKSSFDGSRRASSSRRIAHWAALVFTLGLILVRVDGAPLYGLPRRSLLRPRARGRRGESHRVTATTPSPAVVGPRRSLMLTALEGAATWVEYSALATLTGPVVLPHIPLDPNHVNVEQLNTTVANQYSQALFSGPIPRPVPFSVNDMARQIANGQLLNTGPNILVAYQRGCEWPSEQRREDFVEMLFLAVAQAHKSTGLEPVLPMNLSTLFNLRESVQIAYNYFSPSWMTPGLNIWLEIQRKAKARHKFIISGIYMLLGYEPIYMTLVVNDYLDSMKIGMTTTPSNGAAKLMLQTFALLPCVEAVGVDEVMWRASTVTPYVPSAPFTSQAQKQRKESRRPYNIWYKLGPYSANVYDQLRSQEESANKKRAVVSVIDSGFHLESYMTSSYCLSDAEKSKIKSSCKDQCVEFAATGRCEDKFANAGDCTPQNLDLPESSVFEDGRRVVESHGTVVSSVITAWESSLMPPAVCDNCVVQPIKASDRNMYTRLSSVIQALAFASRRSRVSYLAYQWPAGCTPTYGLNETIWSSVLRTLARKNHIVVMPAGDQRLNWNPSRSAGSRCKFRSRRFKSLLVVGSTDNMGNPTWGTNVGKDFVTLFAPGVGIVAPRPSLEHNICPVVVGLTWASFSGTSFSAAVAAAAVGFILQASDFKVTGTTLVEAIRRSVLPMKYGGDRYSIAGGVIDAECALTLVRRWSQDGVWLNRTDCPERRLRVASVSW